jgi:DNA-binding GntR family transcriptional regulator
MTESVYRELRAGILSGAFAPGQRMRPSELAADLGVSLNVVREALSRLAGESLVRAAAQLGFAVVPVSLADLADLADARIAVETMALRRSIERGDLGWETDLVSAQHRLSRTPITSAQRPGELSADWMRAHDGFHAATLAGCGSLRLIEITAAMSESAAIYRVWSQRYDEGHRDIAGEHRDLFEAVLARDADLACRLLAEHIQRTADIVTAAAIAADKMPATG